MSLAGAPVVHCAMREVGPHVSHLREGRPAGEFLEALADCVVVQDVECTEGDPGGSQQSHLMVSMHHGWSRPRKHTTELVRCAFRASHKKDTYHLAAELALRLLWSALHEYHHVRFAAGSRHTPRVNPERLDTGTMHVGVTYLINLVKRSLRAFSSSSACAYAWASAGTQACYRK